MLSSTGTLHGHVPAYDKWVQLRGYVNHTGATTNASSTSAATNQLFGFNPTCTGVFVRRVQSPALPPAQLAHLQKVKNNPSSPLLTTSAAPTPSTQSSSGGLPAAAPPSQLPTMPHILQYKQQALPRSQPKQLVYRLPQGTGCMSLPADQQPVGTYALMKITVPADFEALGSTLSMAMNYTLVYKPEVCEPAAWSLMLFCGMRAVHCQRALPCHQRAPIVSDQCC